MKLVETYKIDKKGYHPFLIADHWQVAQLNYLAEQHIKNIDKIEVHRKTDEVFVLLKGKAVLILVELINNEPSFEVELMKPRVTYNIPKNVWHNIAMEEGSEILIIEKSNTHLNDVKYKQLNESNIKKLRLMVKNTLTK